MHACVDVQVLALVWPHFEPFSMIALSLSVRPSTFRSNKRTAVNTRLTATIRNDIFSATISLSLSLSKATELKDDRSPSDATVMTTFTILLIDKNDNAPKFNSSEYRVRITELAQVGFALPLFIQAEDKDEVGKSDSAD